MQSTPLLPFLLGQLWPGEVAPDMVLSMGQIELFDIQPECKQTTCFGLVSLFNGRLTFVGYLTPKPFSEKNSSGTI